MLRGFRCSCLHNIVHGSYRGAGRQGGRRDMGGQLHGQHRIQKGFAVHHLQRVGSISRSVIHHQAFAGGLTVGCLQNLALAQLIVNLKTRQTNEARES